MALISRRARPRKITNGTPLVVSSLSAPGMAAAHAEIPPEKWGKRIARPTSDRKDWQKEAWDRLDDVGELRFAIQWKKALVSRFRLVASDLDPDTGRPTGTTENAAARDIVRRIAGGTAGQAQLIGRFTVLLSVPGEGWLAIIYREVEDGAGIKRIEEQWHVLSTEEIETKGQITTIQLQDGTKHEMDPETDTLSRIWDPHPRRTWEADSAVRSALPTLREIIRMGQNIEGAGKSRQAGNGLLVLPEEISMPPKQPPTGEVDPDAPALPQPQPPVQYVTTAEIRAALQAAMAEAIQNPSSAEALVPILLQTKGEWIDKIRHIKFDSQVQEQSITTREKAIRRLALALDMPSEVLLGLADLNHWSLWGVEDEALRWHSAPLMETICDGLTEHLLRPMLERDGIDAENLVVWYDQTDVESDPEHDKHVKEAYELGILKSEAYAREIGVSEDDVYDLTTIEGWGAWAADAVRKNPEHLAILAPILRATLPELELPEAPEPPPPPALEPPPTDNEDDDVQGPPDTRSQSVMVRMCLNQAVTLAAKRRHNRSNHTQLKDLSAAQTHAQLGPVAPEEVDRLIDGWDELLDAVAVQDAGVDLPRLRAVVRQCALAALTSGSAPSVSHAQIRWVRA